jgi:UDP-GlcNAc:undecaprenyl-phosphate GlcNAc-1-phosphate transferase
VSAAVTVVALPVASLVLWALLRSPAVGERLVAVPTGERWHDRPTPTFGGVGIAAGLLAGIAVALLTGAVEPSWELAGISTGCAVLFVAGLIDDTRHLRPVTKLLAQVAAAGIAIAAGLRVELIENDVIGVLVALVWLVGITNAFNLLDNMDGLAATLATVACAYFAIDAATVHENDTVLVLSLSLGFACLGFLPFNLRPGRRATVFMGDAGSQVLGFALAALGLASSWTTAGTTVATMLLPLLVLAIPILDTTLVTVKRLHERRPVTQGGTDHTSHRLVYYGLSEAKAVGLLASIAVVLGATAVAYNVLDRPALTAVGVLASFVLLVQFGAFLGELSESARAGRPGDTRLRHALVVEPRRLAEVLVDFALTCVAFLGAYALVLGGLGGDAERGTFLAALPVLLGVRYVGFVALRVYRRAWRYAKPADFGAHVAACGASELVAWAILALTRDLGDFPAQVFLVDAILFTTLAVAARLAQRLLPSARHAGRRRVLVVGAGIAGRGVARSLREEGMRVVGFVDDDPRLQRRRVLGAPVVGTLEEVGAAIEELTPDEVVVALPHPADSVAAIRTACGTEGVPVRVATETALVGAAG